MARRKLKEAEIQAKLSSELDKLVTQFTDSTDEITLSIWARQVDTFNLFERAVFNLHYSNVEKLVKAPSNDGEHTKVYFYYNGSNTEGQLKTVRLQEEKLNYLVTADGCILPATFYGVHQVLTSRLLTAAATLTNRHFCPLLFDEEFGFYLDNKTLELLGGLDEPFKPTRFRCYL